MIHKTSFTVYPDDCNYMKADTGRAMVHGGKMLLKMDRAAAEAVKKALVKSDAETALTVKSEVHFHHGASLGDLIEFSCTITHVGVKSIEVLVTADRFNPDGTTQPMAEGIFRFCTMKQSFVGGHLMSCPHGLRLVNGEIIRK